MKQCVGGFAEKLFGFVDHGPGTSLGREVSRESAEAACPGFAGERAEPRIERGAAAIDDEH
jgi:hypothetical protein